MGFRFICVIRSDEDSRGFSEVVEQGAGGGGLNGFAETHFIGEERARSPYARWSIPSR